ncbi:anti-sigma factor domain-containing protein [Fictibacillus sp. b24]|uniref:anti-sigma factor domain-containing protein n=1 Tax=Fictibacillus sp. b24 TaxID=3055863 RepID=UPI0025A230B2|nr:anti-sigma factor domain-containing protein [Fictibacillus sp. b24]MDM5315407.1 anti-sigma factor domain-containing protein [Fictibacillus sp. b24]
MNKAIIVEVSKRHLIVLAEGGEFKKVRNTGASYSVGQEVMLPVTEEKSRSIFSGLINWKTGTAAALAIFLLFFQILSPVSGPGVYAYVGMDMDPSLELKIDEDMKVLDIFAYNQQGKMVLERMNDWKNRDIEYVTDLIFDTCKELGYLQTKEEVLITTTLSEEIPADKEIEMKQRVNEVITKTAKKKSVEMTTIVMSSKEREESKKMKMSPGHYAIYTAAKKSGIKITKSEISGQTIEKISEKVGPIKELLKEEIQPVADSAKKQEDLVYEPPLPILDQKEKEQKVKKEKPALPIQEKIEESHKKKTIESPTTHIVIPAAPQREEKKAAEPVKREQGHEKPSHPPTAAVSGHEKDVPKPPVKDIPAAIAPPKDEKLKEEKPKQEKPKEEKPKEEKSKEDKPKEDKPKGEKPKVDLPKEEKIIVDPPKENETPPNPVSEPVQTNPEPIEQWIYIEIVVNGNVITVRIKTDSNVLTEELRKQALALINHNSLLQQQCSKTASSLQQEVEKEEIASVTEQLDAADSEDPAPTNLHTLQAS